MSKKKRLTAKQRAWKKISEWPLEDRILYAHIALYRVCTDPVLFRKVTGPMPQMARNNNRRKLNTQDEEEINDSIE